MPRVKDSYLDSSRDLQAFVLYKKNTIVPGFQIHAFDYFDDIPPNIEKSETANNIYLWLKETHELFFIRNKTVEPVPIADMDKFLRDYDACMNQEFKYDIKHLTPNEIETLITENGGHHPNCAPSSEKPVIPPNFMEDLFPRVGVEKKLEECESTNELSPS